MCFSNYHSSGVPQKSLQHCRVKIYIDAHKKHKRMGALTCSEQNIMCHKSNIHICFKIKRSLHTFLHPVLELFTSLDFEDFSKV